MNRLLLAIILVASQFSTLDAQQARTIRVKAGDDIAQAYSPQGFYRFAQFGKAAIRFKDGSVSAGLHFNLNLLSGHLQFIGNSSDTLDLAGQENIDTLVLSGVVFLYSDGWLEAVADADSVTLYRKITIKTQVENIGAYGMPNQTASIVNLKTYTAATGVYNLVLAQDVVVIENTYWFFADKNKNQVKASKGNLSKVFAPATQKKAEAYLQRNKVNFERESDLRKFMEALKS